MAPEKRESVEEVIGRLRANRDAPHEISESHVVNTSPKTSISQRVSKISPSTRPSERKTEVNKIIKHLLLGELTQGQALKSLRIKILGLKQDVFARLIDVSRKTLSDIENDRGSYNTEILNKVFKPFGLKVGLLPSSSDALKSLLMDGEAG
ncbi:helix-turn-helix domain-containing protein [Vibrio alginolyticus]|nr:MULTISPECIES: helix-turn-helix domain-containing protein [Vibrio]MCG6239193.1 helix-turn-helix domain-containing protein [Vibrio diabolicus]EJG0060331.1 helix-turn-helix domain-containing protein [Vibrio parahaemolyticus]EJG0453695.1 helix-turn-helix domain-containing protein [Vibrio parahaemolyticus]EJG0463665.1 helix-turn-helix domain-containing protein [Vibrio parahaemolyticus]EJG1288629.1 helix-turn-helix domain-containing protein [Vibrio parahaemolyticus]